jgi:hypothetical protein
MPDEPAERMERRMSDAAWLSPDDDDDPMGDSDGEDASDSGDECGRWRNGVLGSFRYCLQAGTEFCQFECPFGFQK